MQSIPYSKKVNGATYNIVVGVNKDNSLLSCNQSRFLRDCHNFNE